MDIKNRLQNLEVAKQRATQEAVMQENMLQGARLKVAEIQGRINELLLVQKDLPVEEEGAEGEENAPTIEGKEKKTKKRKYNKTGNFSKKKQEERPKIKHKTRGGTELFPADINAFIGVNWENNSDPELRQLIGNKFKRWYGVDQLKAHRRMIGCVAGRPGRKPRKDDVDDMADDLDE